MIDNNAFSPDWTSHPGETVADILEERSLTAHEFARRIGHTLERTMELLDGRAPITIQTAQKLELVLGVPAAFWTTREAQYRQDLARIKSNDLAEGWLEELPIADMIKFGWIPKVRSAADKVAACLRFFNVTTVDEWRATQNEVLGLAAFRTSPAFDSQQGAVFSWLRQGEIKSAELACEPWDPKRFEEALPHIRPLTRKKDPGRFIPELMEICAACGVAVTVVRSPSGCRASGATRFLSPTRALLLLSFRYLSDDHFWFTFFHEAGHLLLHGEKALCLEDVNMSSAEEDAANTFAASILIPSQFQADLMRLRTEVRDVIRFAQLVGVSPGVVVGQLQKQGRIQPSQLNYLRRRFKWE